MKPRGRYHRFRLLDTLRIDRSDKIEWQGNKDSNLGMLESKSSALTSLAIPLHNLLLVALTTFNCGSVATG